MKIIISRATTEQAYIAEKALLPVKAYNFRKLYKEGQFFDNPVLFDIEIKRVMEVHVSEYVLSFVAYDTGEYIEMRYEPTVNEITVND